MNLLESCHKYIAVWITQALFTKYLKILDAKMTFLNKSILIPVGQCASHPQDTHYLKKVRVAVENCTSILQSLDQEITRSFKHVIQPYCKDTISVIDIFINCNWVVTWWQYTFTHKQYIEQHK